MKNNQFMVQAAIVLALSSVAMPSYALSLGASGGASVHVGGVTADAGTHATGDFGTSLRGGDLGLKAEEDSSIPIDPVDATAPGNGTQIIDSTNEKMITKTIPPAVVTGTVIHDTRVENGKVVGATVRNVTRGAAELPQDKGVSYTSVDTNRDGLINNAELNNYNKRAAQRSKEFIALDTNGSGDLSKVEFAAGVTSANFSAIDVNSNGMISDGEFDAYMRIQKK